MTNPSRTTRVPLGLSLLLLSITLVGAHAEQSETPDTQPATAGFAEAPIHLDQAQRQMIGLTYGVAERKPVEKVIHTVGRFDYDERKLAEVVLKVSGYIQDVFVDYTGKAVKKGDPLFSIYSPDLVSAQQEYLLARDNARALGESDVPGARESADSLLRASRERLRLWDLTDAQVAALERSGKPKLAQIIYSPIAGVVTEKTALKGHAVEPGMVLYKIADLSTIWVYGDIYEYELPLVRVGQEATITNSYDPTAHFTARVAYISPTLDPKTRTAKVRFELKNSADHVLRPETYGTVELHVRLGERLIVPSTAVLDSGRRQVVFVDGGDGRLLPRPVKVGGRFDDTLEIVDGLQAGERIVTSGNFLVDSESKLQAAESMMGMMGAIGMGDWKMESAKPMDMGGGGATVPIQPPPSTPAAPPSAPAPQGKQVGDLLVDVSPASEPTTKGESTIQVHVRDAKGQPVTGAKVSFSYTMDMPGMRIEQSEAKDVGNGLYQGTARFTMGGPWGLVVQIERSGMPVAREKFTVRVSG
jgi:membrane fusion protein, copper/silver efflux system